MTLHKVYIKAFKTYSSKEYHEIKMLYISYFKLTVVIEDFFLFFPLLKLQSSL